jgi:hypothetical protein
MNWPEAAIATARLAALLDFNRNFEIFRVRDEIAHLVRMDSGCRPM